jgi:integrase
MDALGEFTSTLAAERVVTDPTNGDEVTLYCTLKEHWARDGEDWNAEAMIEPMAVMLRESGLPKPAKHAPAWGWLVSEFDARLHQLSAWALARHEGGSTLPGDGALPHLPLSTEVKQAALVEAQRTPGRTLKALFDTYAEAKRSIDKSRSTEVTLGEYGSAIDDFIELHGDVGVEIISRDLVSEHHVKLAKLPGKGKGMAKLTAPERIARAERDGLPRLSIATVRNRLRKISAVLTYGVGRGWLTENPINSSGLGREVARAATRHQSTTRRRKHYTHEDLATIFSSVAFTDLAWKPARASFDRAWYWLPILMYYSGARIEELAQLDASDVKHSSEGVPYLGVLEGVDGDDGARTVKTESSRRMIPLHGDVVARGFLKYVEGLPAKGRLFPKLDPCPDGYYSTNFAKRWGHYLRDTVGLKTSANPSHGFRHTFKTLAREVNIAEDVHDAITGHAGGCVGRSYGAMPLATMAAELRRFPTIAEMIERARLAG